MNQFLSRLKTLFKIKIDISELPVCYTNDKFVNCYQSSRGFTIRMPDIRKSLVNYLRPAGIAPLFARRKVQRAPCGRDRL